MTGPDSIRLDKWLWYARFFRSRAAAARLCAEGGVRIGGIRVEKAHYAVRVGDVLTFAQARQIRVVRVRALGTRRGPATEARTLYDDLAESPPIPRPAFAAAFLPGGTRDGER